MAVRKVGNARIIRELGRGAMGVVYQAAQDDLGRMVAVKELPSAAAQNHELAERFRREGAAYAKLRHHNIPAVHDLVDKNDALYLIVEYVDGPDLARLARQGPLPPGIVAAIGARIADALAHAHHHKLLHRDVKPPNVLVSLDGSVKLTDFGVVKDLQASDLTREGMIVGSLPYMAPEVLASGDYDPRADIWALGVTLYELAAGTRPFNGKDDGALMNAILSGRHRHVRNLSPGMPRRLGRAIERCLARRRDKRWPAALVLARELDACAVDLLDALDAEDAIAKVLQERGFVPADSEDAAAPPTRLDPGVMHETNVGVAIIPSPKVFPWMTIFLFLLLIIATGSYVWLRG